MKLVVYDDLPSPGFDHRRQRSSLSSWVVEGRNLASRASTRASMSWKRQSTTPLKIGAPTDFRRVDSFHLQSMPEVPDQYQPLELSIHRSSQRLSDLPSFDSFQVDDTRQRQWASRQWASRTQCESSPASGRAGRTQFESSAVLRIGAPLVAPRVRARRHHARHEVPIRGELSLRVSAAGAYRDPVVVTLCGRTTPA